MTKENRSKGGKIGGKISMAKMSKESRSKGGKNRPAHKIGVWYDAYCNNPKCVALTTVGKVKLGQSRENDPPSRHQYNDKNGKSVQCGYYKIRLNEVSI